MNTASQSLTRQSARLPIAARPLLLALQRISHGTLTLIDPQGQSQHYQGQNGKLHATLQIHDWQALGRISRSGDIGLAEAYRDGQIDSPDWAALICLAIANEDALEQAIHGSWLGTLAYWLRHLARANTRTGSRRNIHAHYDLGNAFYRLWLDGSMSYSSALFDGDQSRSLEDAQTAKYERILARLNPAPGASILEIGCGWGGFAEYAIRTRGVHITGVTLSTEQLAYAQARLKAAGIERMASLSLTDYRDVGGSFDHIVSIEMLEAVGERWWPSYFASLRERLKPGGSAMVQVITIADEYFARYRKGTDFIQQYIFPGGMLPSPGALKHEIGRAGLSLVDDYRFGADYAETLRRWQTLFEAKLPEIHTQGFDVAFIRLWRFYYAYCIAGFDTERTNVCQLEIHRP
jgi:cyclopropane-fatty-acyl-phospholipid synthase